MIADWLAVVLMTFFIYSAEKAAARPSSKASGASFVDWTMYSIVTNIASINVGILPNWTLDVATSSTSSRSTPDRFRFLDTFRGTSIFATVESDDDIVSTEPATTFVASSSVRRRMGKNCLSERIRAALESGIARRRKLSNNHDVGFFLNQD